VIIVKLWTGSGRGRNCKWDCNKPALDRPTLTAEPAWNPRDRCSGRRQWSCPHLQSRRKLPTPVQTAGVEVSCSANPIVGKRQRRQLQEHSRCLEQQTPCPTPPQLRSLLLPALPMRLRSAAEPDITATGRTMHGPTKPPLGLQGVRALLQSTADSCGHQRRECGW